MEEDDDELANRKTNERIQLQPTCIRAGTLFAQHVRSIICVNTFVCMQAQ